jgi:hypothetical protein
MRVVLMGLLILLSASSGAAAQSCGNGLPCGPIPWRLPNLPDLKTPTPASRVDEGYASIPLLTSPAEATALPGLEVGMEPVAGQVEMYLTATQICILDVYGRCMEQDPQAYAPEPFLIFGYFRSLAGVNLGVFNPVLWFLLAAFSSVLAFTLASRVLPILVVLLGLVRKFVNLMLNFLPF